MLVGLPFHLYALAFEKTNIKICLCRITRQVAIRPEMATEIKKPGTLFAADGECRSSPYSSLDIKPVTQHSGNGNIQFYKAFPALAE